MHNAIPTVIVHSVLCWRCVWWAELLLYEANTLNACHWLWHVQGQTVLAREEQVRRSEHWHKVAQRLSVLCKLASNPWILIFVETNQATVGIGESLEMRLYLHKKVLYLSLQDKHADHSLTPCLSTLQLGHTVGKGRLHPDDQEPEQPVWYCHRCHLPNAMNTWVISYVVANRHLLIVCVVMI